MGTATALNRVAKRLGVSQSALLSELIGEPIAMLEEVLEAIGWEPTTETVARARGKSIEQLSGVLAQIRKVMDALESTPGNR